MFVSLDCGRRATEGDWSLAAIDGEACPIQGPREAGPVKTDIAWPEKFPIHPAPYSASILSMIDELLPEKGAFLDPMCGSGRCFDFATAERVIVGTEIEPAFAALHPRTIQADATRLPFGPRAFDGGFCLAQQHRVLTADLRWVPVGDLVVGDQLAAFEENGNPLRGRGRRRWEWSEVIRSVPRKVACVLVTMANGDEIITTPEHLWLARRENETNVGWYPSSVLMGRIRQTGPGSGRGARGLLHPRLVLKFCDTWSPRSTFDAGWLAGMLDGEGSLSFGSHGSPKLLVSQTEGALLGKVEQLMTEFGYDPMVYLRDRDDGRRKMADIYIRGGFPYLVRALGELRPTRLLEKWLSLDLSTREIRARGEQVVSVSRVGVREIQEVTTSSGTFIGEGYLMHNCSPTYPNRMNGDYAAPGWTKNPSGRRNYSLSVRWLSRDPGAELHHTDTARYGVKRGLDEYWRLHRLIWAEVARVIRPGGLFILNTKDLPDVPVTDPHVGILTAVGFTEVGRRRAFPPGYRNGANRDLRVDGEDVVVLERSA